VVRGSGRGVRFAGVCTEAMRFFWRCLAHSLLSASSPGPWATSLALASVASETTKAGRLMGRFDRMMDPGAGCGVVGVESQEIQPLSMQKEGERERMTLPTQNSWKFVAIGLQVNFETFESLRVD